MNADGLLLNLSDADRVAPSSRGQRCIFGGGIF
jgi:hypothetical protein